MTQASRAHPDFESAQFLRDHISRTLAFYDRTALDPSGGFFHCFRDDGSVYDRDLRHLVSSCRFVFNYAQAHVRDANRDYQARAAHGLEFLERRHRQCNGAYAWELQGAQVSDGRVMTYGHAFVLLAAASALAAGVEGARDVLDRVWQFLEDHMWRAGDMAYVDEYDATLRVLSPYRGQNANMHMCEACIAAWKATGEARFLDRAKTLARKFARTLADRCGGYVWEHYDQAWQPDMKFNRDRPNDLFKPWGVQPGHQFEWARLLLMLAAERPEDWYHDRAIQLYATGMKHGRDDAFGGVVYGYGPDGTVCAGEKYYWVHSEGFAAAWRLYRLTGKDTYRADYHALWSYAWDNFVDHEHGAWFRILTREGQKIDDLKSPPGKTDYHTLGACWDVLSDLGTGATSAV